jgi:hypothetical protein
MFAHLEAVMAGRITNLKKWLEPGKKALRQRSKIHGVAKVNFQLYITA